MGFRSRGGVDIVFHLDGQIELFLNGFFNLNAGVIRNILAGKNNFAKLAVDLPRGTDADAIHTVGKFADKGHNFVHQMRPAQARLGGDFKR